MKLNTLILSLLLFTIFSCKDDNVIDNSPLNSIQSSRDHLIAEYLFNDVEKMVEEAFINNLKNKTCPNYTLKNINQTNQDTLIINFGTGNNICPPIYGNIRSGKIIVIYTGNYRDSLTSINTTFDNFRINNQLIQGEKNITNEGRNNLGNMWFSVNVIGGLITTINGNIDWNSNYTKEWINGSSTISNTLDDKYIISGNANGNSVNGNDFTVSITNPLILDQECLLQGKCNIKSGDAKVSTSNMSERIIMYGDSVCDCNIDILVDDYRYPIIIN